MEMNVGMLLWLWIIVAPTIAFIALSSFGGSGPSRRIDEPRRPIA
jgi:hypothetical protein